MPPYPHYNPYSESKVELGKKLFNDPKLSSSNQIACASCHDRELDLVMVGGLAMGIIEHLESVILQV